MDLVQTDQAPTTEPVATAVEAPRRTFAEILHLLEEADSGMETPIDLVELGALLGEKIDAIRHVDKRLDAHLAFLGEQIDELKKRVAAVENNKRRLRDYVTHHMVEKGFAEIPGQKWRVIVKPKTPKLLLDRKPGPSDFVAHPDMVEMERTYSWNKDVLRERIESGQIVPWARLERGHCIQFYPRKDQ